MKNSTRKFGFTLIELMIVIAIIGILAGMAVPNFQRAREQAREKKCWESTSMLTRLSEQYNIDNRQYPAKVDDLRSYVSGGSFAHCPLGMPYEFLVNPPTEDTGAVVKCPKHGYASATIGAH